MNTATEDSPAAARVTDAPLEDVMVAMDVVDTVRHRQILVDRELNAGARRERLRERLRDIYAAQGIEVTDDALDAGIAALEEERFRYRPVESGFSTWLARKYVARSRWGKKARVFAIFGAVVFGIWLFDGYLPERRLRAEAPEAVRSAYNRVVDAAASDDVVAVASALNADAEAALSRGDYETAAELAKRLEVLLQRVRESYDVRVVSRPDELSGVWRVPSINEEARNYYLIVEAVGPTGRVLNVPIVSEETGHETLVDAWGVRVSEETFEAVAADKRDDGIVQNSIVGSKPAGQLSPDYSIPTLGGFITTW